MACGASPGLKVLNEPVVLVPQEGLNGLWSPSGIERLMDTILSMQYVRAKWPGSPSGIESAVLSAFE